MSTLHKITNNDPIWDAVYDEDEFIGYDRSETGPLLRVVAAELRRLAEQMPRGLIRQAGLIYGSDGSTVKAVQRALRTRADELAGEPE